MYNNSIGVLGSMTKPLTGLAILMLMEEGKLNLYDRIGNYIPAFRNNGKHKITIFQLLTHTSGIIHKDFYQSYSKFSTLNEAVQWLSEKDLDFDPGAGFQYTSFGYSLLGEIIRNITGMPSEQYIQERILNPLEMSDSFF